MKFSCCFINSFPATKNGALCTVCKMVVGFVDAELKNSKTEVVLVELLLSLKTS